MEHDGGSQREPVVFRCWKFSERLREQTHILKVVGRRPSQWTPHRLPSVFCSLEHQEKAVGLREEC